MTEADGPDGATGSGTELGVVIPTLNEARTLPRLLDDLARLPMAARVVVADGGSSDGTVQVARERGARVVRAPRGRARQMNVGAAALSTPWLLFLHADSRVPAETRQALARWLAEPPPEGAAHFAFRLDARGTWWSLIEWGQRVRERLTGLAYGDQGLLVSRERWQAVGGVPDLPLMEDVEFTRRLRRSGGLRRIDAPVITSARRYEEEGPLRAWLRNAALITLFGIGVPTRSLARFYPTRNGEPGIAPPDDAPLRSDLKVESGTEAAGSRVTNVGATPMTDAAGRSGTDPRATPMVLVFAKAPRPGEVKTRLAADLGPEEAARIYRQMGRQVVDQLRDGPFRLRVCHTPADAEAEMRAWLGEEGLEYRPQSSGDLGRRMDRASQEALRETGRVCIVGTDAPDVDAPLVRDALAHLEDHDVVFGPARDGGYYLVALRRPAPTLFQGIPWSTDRVLEESLAAAARSNLSVSTLPMLSDVDRVEDLPPAFRAT